MTPVLLTWNDLLPAAQAGVVRTYQQRAAGARASWGSQTGQLDWNHDIYAAAAELAVAKLTGRFWSRPVGWEPGGADVGTDIQVRFSPRPGASLIIKRSDNPEHRFVLVGLGQPEPAGITLEVIGWMSGAAAMQPRYWRTDVPDPAWFVPAAHLADVPVARTA